MFHVTERASEIELEIHDVDVEGLFTDAILALGDVFSAAAAERGEPVTHRVELGAADPEGLFKTWIDELIALAESENFVPERVAKLDLAATAIRATVSGERGIAQSLIKDVSSHRIAVGALEDGTWSATVILDVAG
ncbi:MAG TPA: archease [Solirubrobacterales bacterium]|nr:archease [Solirubrobacterales bacterium]